MRMRAQVLALAGASLSSIVVAESRSVDSAERYGNAWREQQESSAGEVRARKNVECRDKTKAATDSRCQDQSKGSTHLPPPNMGTSGDTNESGR